MANINWITVLLLGISNLVMLYAWYGHLRNMSGAPIWKVILVSWLIALVEYFFMIPANRLGAKTMTLEQLKIIQEALSLLIFIPFSIFIMKSHISWNYAAASLLIMGAVVYFPTANGKDSSEVGKMRICEGMKKPRAGELQGA